jgi:hypothetical protein
VAWVLNKKNTEGEPVEEIFYSETLLGMILKDLKGLAEK